MGVTSTLPYVKKALKLCLAVLSQRFQCWGKLLGVVDQPDIICQILLWVRIFGKLTEDSCGVISKYDPTPFRCRNFSDACLGCQQRAVTGYKSAAAASIVML